jgi:hypothetical protein
MDVTFGYSPSSSRVVVRRWPASKPTSPSEREPSPNDTLTEAEAPSALAVSERVRAGMRLTWLASAVLGLQVSSRMARR